MVNLPLNGLFKFLIVIAPLVISGCASDVPKIADNEPTETIEHTEPDSSPVPDYSVPVQPIVPEPLASSLIQSHECDVLTVELMFILRRGEILNYEYTTALVQQIRDIHRAAIEKHCYLLATAASSSLHNAQSFQEYYAIEKRREKNKEEIRKKIEKIEDNISDMVAASTCFKNLRSLKNPYLFTGVFLGCSLYMIYTQLPDIEG